MAILYGTQSNGVTLPVQVNSFGQLVAQGLNGAKGEKGDKGDKGEQGDQGIEGPPGPGVEVVTTVFTPILSLTGDGDYVAVDGGSKGLIYDLAGLTLISFSLVINDFGITNPRGEPRISGFPVLKMTNWRNPEGHQGYLNRSSFFKNDELIRITLDNGGDKFKFDRAVNNISVPCMTTDIRDVHDGPIQLTGVFFGARATASEALEQSKRASEPWPNT